MSRDQLNVALLGHGYWGKNLARNVAAHPDLKLAHIADPSEKALERAADLYPLAGRSTDPHEVVSEAEVDVVIVATPLATHFDLTKEAIKSGRHVVVTKPLAATSAEAEELAEMAEANERVLLIDNTFAYTGAVRKVRAMVQSGMLGDLVYCSSTRINLGTYRRDSSVIWDLAPHDISILHAVGFGKPSAVAATAGGKMGGPMDQIAHVTLFYPSGCLAHINVSWLAPVKTRTMIFGGSKQMVVYDDVEPSEKVKVYDKGVRMKLEEGSNNLQEPPEYRLGDMFAPQLDQTEALFAELSHLIRCIRDGEQPITDGRSGVEAIRILEGASLSAEQGGELIEL